MNIDPREWQAQESAKTAVWNGTPTTDPLAARYVAVMQALAQPPTPELAPDFAATIAREATRRARREARFERASLAAVLAAFVIGAIGVAATQGGDWLHAVTASLPLPDGPMLQWLALVAVCVGLSWCVPSRVGVH